MDMNKNNDNRKYVSSLTIVALLAMTAIVAVPAATLQQAFAHAHTELTLADEHVAGKKISVVIGHTNEPTYGARAGIHDGKHSLEVTLSDGATALPLTGAQLQADKYYFKDIKSFEKADSVDDADQMVKGVRVGAVFGDAGHYVARQVQKDGIYGYRLYGNITYFGVAEVQIDSTIFCNSANGNTTKFNSPGWTGAYGCTENISNTMFPAKSTTTTTKKTTSADADGQAAVQKVAVAASPSSATLASAGPEKIGAQQQQEQEQLQTSWMMWILGGLPIAAVGAVFGWNSLRKNKPKNGESPK
jgi:hypothetical protein